MKSKSISDMPWRGMRLVSLALVLASVAGRPNVVFILTDDQDVALGGMTPLSRTKRLVADEGVTFANAFATTPICCPSRSSILTGLYLHSHGTVNNSLSGGCGGRQWQRRFEGRTFAAALRGAGYRTFYAGKYLNQYGRKSAGGVGHVPEGWDWWVGLVGNSVYYNYTLSVNGTAVRKGDEDADYLTDVLKEHALEFLKGGRKEPFLMVIAPPAPHEPFTPARRHEGKFAGLSAPRTPNFNLPTKRDKHWLLRLPPRVLPEETVRRIDDTFRRRWESLLAVDDLVEAVVLRLEELRVLKDTYVMLASDHGFHLGQFGLPWDKRQPYEEDIRIPLVVRGPQTVRGTSDGVVLNTDVAATILDMAETSVKKFGDGKSFLPLVNSAPTEASRTFLVEYRGEGEGRGNECNADPNVKLCRVETSCKCFDAKNNTFTCVRRLSTKADDIYCEFADDDSFTEYYDIRKDPHQLENVGGGIEAETLKRILDCCEQMIQLNKAVDKCFAFDSQSGLGSRKKFLESLEETEERGTSGHQMRPKVGASGAMTPRTLGPNASADESRLDLCPTLIYCDGNYAQRNSAIMSFRVSPCLDFRSFPGGTRSSRPFVCRTAAFDRRRAGFPAFERSGIPIFRRRSPARFGNRGRFSSIVSSRVRSASGKSGAAFPEMPRPERRRRFSRHLQKKKFPFRRTEGPNLV